LLDPARASLADGELVVGIDEETALVHDGGTWVVDGRQAVHVFTREDDASYSAGASVPLPPL
jgi:hypothetical protein